MSQLMKQKVSIIIPAFNEEKVIERLLKSLKKQTYKNCEVIVIDDSSVDNTVKIAKQYTPNVYTRKHAERSIQRNFGAGISKGEYLLFLDADMELIPGVVKECVEKIQKDKKSGAIAIPEKSIALTFWEKVKAFERSIYNLEGDSITDAARFFTREAFNKAGGYDESITGPEDWDLPDTIRELGYKQNRIKAIIYHYERVPSPLALARKKYYYGLRAYRYLTKHKISVISAKTIYFLRPVFYKNWARIIAHPVLSLGMMMMLSAELIGGGLGFLMGRIKKL